MAIYARDSGGGNFTPAPVGQHAVVCCDVADLGMVDGKWLLYTPDDVVPIPGEIDSTVRAESNAPWTI